MCRAEQACWQENTSGEGQQSLLWPCWRQWHNSNTYRVQLPAFTLWRGCEQNPAWSPLRARQIPRCEKLERSSVQQTRLLGNTHGLCLLTLFTKVPLHSKLMYAALWNKNEIKQGSPKYDWTKAVVKEHWGQWGKKEKQTLFWLTISL